MCVESVNENLNLIDVDLGWADTSLDVAGESENSFQGQVELDPEMQKWVHTINLVQRSDQYNVFGERVQMHKT